MPDVGTRGRYNDIEPLKKFLYDGYDGDFFFLGFNVSNNNPIFHAGTEKM